MAPRVMVATVNPHMPAWSLAVAGVQALEIGWRLCCGTWRPQRSCAEAKVGEQHLHLHHHHHHHHHCHAAVVVASCAGPPALRACLPAPPSIASLRGAGRGTARCAALRTGRVLVVTAFFPRSGGLAMPADPRCEVRDDDDDGPQLPACLPVCQCPQHHENLAPPRVHRSHLVPAGVSWCQLVPAAASGRCMTPGPASSSSADHGAGPWCLPWRAWHAER
jgi:hypothetical protein